MGLCRGRSHTTHCGSASLRMSGLQMMSLTLCICTDDKKLSFLWGANNNANRCTHADHMCAALILPSWPLFWEATSNVSEPRARAADSETSAEAECRGNPLQGTRLAAQLQQTAGFGRCMPRHARMGPLLAWGLYSLVVSFFSVPKPCWCGGMYVGPLETTETKQRKQGFHCSPWSVEIHAIRNNTVNNKYSPQCAKTLKSMLRIQVHASILVGVEEPCTVRSILLL